MEFWRDGILEGKRVLESPDDSIHLFSSLSIVSGTSHSFMTVSMSFLQNHSPDGMDYLMTIKSTSNIVRDVHK